MELYNENIARLIQRSLLGELTEKERQELEAWLKDSREHGVLFNKVKKDMRVSVESPVFCLLNDELAWLKFKTITRKRKRQVVIWHMLKYVAVIAVPLIISVFWYLGQRDNVVKLATQDRKTGEIVLREVDVRRYIAWKDGFFAFEEESLEEIMNTLSLWYNVDVFFQSESVKGLVFTGYMRRYSDVMESLMRSRMLWMCILM
ncbi:MAG: DUF4974 domain-containing protein [Sanguibacteroides justesenii]|uniref:FecR domain-containing protein n=1 Tax=Butyricimonas virosa TaxID=544645 RepID=UPI001DD6563D|nr:DUF4974 domain-containing protein [Sanguibacteroides justesenii]